MPRKDEERSSNEFYLTCKESAIFDWDLRDTKTFGRMLKAPRACRTQGILLPPKQLFSRIREFAYQHFLLVHRRKGFATAQHMRENVVIKFIVVAIFQVHG